MAKKGFMSFRTGHSHEECEFGLQELFKNYDICSECLGSGSELIYCDDSSNNVTIKYEQYKQLVKIKKYCDSNLGLNFSYILKKAIRKGLGLEEPCKKCGGKIFIKKRRSNENKKEKPKN